jgi:uncharacterized protein (TIGR03435 family)
MSSFSATGMLLFTIAIPACAFARAPGAPQSQSPPSSAFVFDVAAIHVHIPEPHEHNSIWSSPFDGQFRAANVNAKSLLQFAFGIPETRILNGPAWIGSTMFNIDAKAGGSVDDRMRTLSSDEGKAQKRLMLQGLLADRFRLAAHTETRELPIYALVITKGGPRLGAVQEGGTTVNHGRDHVEVQGSNSVALLAEELSKDVGRPVVDKTGIEGRYHLTLKWTPDDAAPASDPSEPSIFTALQEQLGLKLEPQKGPVEVLVIDHIEMPSEN